MIFNWRTEVWIVLHSTINQFDSFILEFLTVANFTSISTSSVGIVSGRWRRRPTPRISICQYFLIHNAVHIPLALRRNEVIQSQLPVNLFQAKVDGIVIEMSLGDTIGGDCCR